MKVGDLIKLKAQPEKGRIEGVGVITGLSSRSDWVYVEFMDRSRLPKWYGPREMEIVSASR